MCCLFSDYEVFLRLIHLLSLADSSFNSVYKAMEEQFSCENRGLVSEGGGIDIMEKFSIGIHKEVEQKLNSMFYSSLNTALHGDLQVNNVLLKGGIQ